MVVKKINFQYNDCITVVSKEQYDAHTKLYSNYVNKINEITDILETDPKRQDANSIYSFYRGLKVSETFALDGVILHELYFENLGGVKSNIPDELMELFDMYYGGYENWLADFIACSKSARGWCLFCYEQRTESFRNLLLDAHNVGVVAMAYPLLVIDMYEHAYFLDYQTDKDAYINNFIKNIDWNIVLKRFKVLT